MRNGSFKLMSRETCIYKLPEWVDIRKLAAKTEYKEFRAIYLASFGDSFRRRFILFLKKRQLYVQSYIWLYKGEYVGIYTLQEYEHLRITPSINFRVLYNFALRPDMQGKGLGRVLLASALTETAKLGGTELVLTVAEQNTKALSLYTHTGFTVTNKEEK